MNYTYGIYFFSEFTGNYAVGKTSLTHRYMSDTFSPTVLTVTPDFNVKRLEVDQERIRLHVWDTAGQERFDSLSYKHYRGANGVLLVYDVTRKSTFDDVALWLENIRKHCHQDMHAVLVGNKCDLMKEREVSYAEGERLSKELEISFFETSAKDNHLVTSAFIELIKLILNETTFPLLTPRYLENSNDVHKILCTCCS